MTTVAEPDVLEREVSPTLPAAGGSAVNAQVATARQYPRSIATFIRRATEMATLTPEIAGSCVYALPRGGKAIEGPSARLAEIVAHAWGNLRIQAGATENDDRYITARGEAWDVESNVAIAFEVRRRITDSKGATYNDDMITVTGNAAASIALRNAVFKAVPSSFWKPIYQKCRQVIAGDSKTFASRRDDMLKAFLVAGVTNERLCAGLGLKGVADLTLDHMATLVGVLNALKEGETTVEAAFPESGGVQPPTAAPRKSQQAAAPVTAAPVATPPPAAVPTATATPAPPAPGKVGTIATVDVRPSGAALITLNTGFVCGTSDRELVTWAQRYKDSGVTVEIVAAAPRTPAHAPKLEEIRTVTADEREPGSVDA